MGRERTGKRNHFLLYPACCIALLVGICGCIHFPEPLKGETRLELKGETRLEKARMLFEKGQYEASLKEAKEVLRLSPSSEERSQAEVWALLVKEIIDKEMTIGELKQKNEDLRKALEIEKNNGNKLQAEVDKLKDQLLRLKEIDLGIEEKKSYVK